MRVAKSQQLAATFAYIAAAVNLVNIEVIFFGGTVTPLLSLIFNFPIQLLYLFIVSVLPCPSWARVCGYSACIIQIILFVAASHDIPVPTAISFYLGAVAVKALWIAVSSWEMKGVTKIVGIVLALLIIYSMFFPLFLQKLLVFQSGLIFALYALWFLLVGRMLMNNAKNLPTLLTFPAG